MIEPNKDALRRLFLKQDYVGQVQLLQFLLLL